MTEVTNIRQTLLFRKSLLMKTLKNSSDSTITELFESSYTYCKIVVRRLEALGFTRNLFVVFHISLQRINGNSQSLPIFPCFSSSNWAVIDIRWQMGYVSNPKCREIVCQPSDLPESTMNSEFHPKKNFLCLRWTEQGIIQWEILPPNKSLMLPLFSSARQNPNRTGPEEFPASSISKLLLSIKIMLGPPSAVI